MTRAERASEVLRLRASGLSSQGVAAAMGVSYSYVRELLSDPDGRKVRERKTRNRGRCEDCGAHTDGSNGINNAPAKCLACHNKAREAQHGTRSRYHAGCRCDACRNANSLAYYDRLNRPGGAPSHGVSGYMNYGCRCDVCRAAGSEYQRARWRKRVAA